MAMCLVWQSEILGMVETGPFFLLGDEQLILRGGGGGQFFKKNFLAVKTLKINFLAWVPRKINNPASIRFK